MIINSRTGRITPFLLIGGTFLIVLVVVVGLTPTRTSAEACVRQNPTIEVTPSVQYGEPGRILNYSYRLTNNNSAGCGVETFEIKPYFLPGSIVESGYGEAKLDRVAPGATDDGRYQIKSAANAPLGTKVRFNIGAYLVADGVTYKTTKDLFYQIGTPTTPLPGENPDPEPGPDPEVPPPVPPTATGTVVSLLNQSLLNDASRLGINIGYTAGFDTAVHFRKNIVHNPGFEEATLRSNYTLKNGGAEGGLAANQVQEFCWQTEWGTGSDGKHFKGQGLGAWAGGDYEFIAGPAWLKDVKGKVTAFTFKADKNGASRYTFTLDKNLPKRPDYLNTILQVRKTFDNFDRSQKRPGSPGDRSLKLDSNRGDGGDYPFLQYFDDGARTKVEDGYAGKMLVVEGPWRLSVWAKAEQPGDKLFVSFSRQGLPAFLDKEITLTDTNWREYTFNFMVPAGLDARNVSANILVQPVSLKIATRTHTYSKNRGSVWIDDLYLGEADNTNPTVFSDQAVKMLKELNPGVLRYWGGNLGEPIENVLGSEWERGTSNFSTEARENNTLYFSSLPEILDLAKAVDADPWYVVPPTLTTQELEDLTDYVNFRVGEFDRIYLEYGNEMWGTGCDDPFKGATVSFNLPTLADEAFRVMKGAGLSSKVKLVIGGQAAYVDRQNQIEQGSDTHNLTAIAPYYQMNGRANSTVASLLGHLYADPLVRNIPGSKINQSASIVRVAGREPAIYEINFHDTGNQPAIALKNKIITGQAGGITLPLQMLHAMKGSGIRAQTAFTFSQFAFRDTGGNMTRLWGVVRDLDNGRAFRGTGLALVVANKAIFGDLIKAEVSGGRTWVQSLPDEVEKDRSANHTVPYLQTFAFKDGNRYGLIVFNLHQTETLKTKLDLLGTGGSGRKYWLYHPDPLANNERNIQLRVEEAPVTINESTEYEFPPHSITSLVWNE